MLTYEDLYCWRGLVEYYLENFPPSFRQGNIGVYPEYFPDIYRPDDYLGIDAKPNRDKLYSFYHCNLFWFDPSGKNKGWKLIKKDVANEKIWFLERVILLNKDPQKLDKPWLQESLEKSLDEIIRTLDAVDIGGVSQAGGIPYIPQRCQKAREIMSFYKRRPREFDAVLGGQQKGPRPYDAVLGGEEGRQLERRKRMQPPYDR